MALLWSCAGEGQHLAPPIQDTAKSVLVIVEVGSEVDLTARRALEMEPHLLRSFPEDATVLVTLVYFDEDLEELGLLFGAHEIAVRLPKFLSAFFARFDGSEPVTWVETSELSPTIAALIYPASATDIDCESIVARQFRTAASLRFGALALAGERVLVGGRDLGSGQAILGRFFSEGQGRIEVFPLPQELFDVRALAFDGTDTVWGYDASGSIFSATPSGELSSRVDYAGAVTLSAGNGTVLAYSRGGVFELQKSSSSAVSRPDFPADLVSIAVVSADRIAAVTSLGNIHVLDPTGWHLEYQYEGESVGLPPKIVFGDADVLVALAESGPLVRSETQRTWVRIPDPIPAAAGKLGGAGLGRGDYLLLGSGVIMIWNGQRWCDQVLVSSTYFYDVAVVDPAQQSAYVLDLGGARIARIDY